MKKKAYEKPALIFEKDLEAMAASCGGASGDPNVYTGASPSYCKTLAGCTGNIDS